MKKIIILILLVIFIVGCNNKKTTMTKKKVKKIEEVEKYTDLNDTKIGIYKEKGNKLELVKDYKTDVISDKDIDTFQIYPSNEEEILLNNNFGSSFYERWTSLNNYNNLKIGFSIKYKLDGNDISHTILNPNSTIINEYIFAYLYDDYKNRDSYFYSHIEDSEYNEETLFTSIKLYANDVSKLESKITLIVFTYDTEDDFDSNNNYRGNSSYEINICPLNQNC